jgi:hypothetical protein
MMEGVLRDRDGKLYVLYKIDEDAEPFRQHIWYRVLETRGTGYGERPEAGDIARSTGGGTWQTRNSSTHRSTGSVSIGSGSTRAELVERIGVPPPAASGKELRWRGRWEKLLARGWVPAGEGRAKSSPRKKSARQLDAEIDEALGER